MGINIPGEIEDTSTPKRKQINNRKSKSKSKNIHLDNKKDLDYDSNEDSQLIHNDLESSLNSKSGNITLWSDMGNIVLLIVLYLLQGIPLGLTFGSVPFLLKSKTSYSDLAIFSLSQYPYSLKLFWSPIVDTFFSGKLGRRKSWIIPIQFITGAIMLFYGPFLDTLLESDPVPVRLLSIIFIGVVFLCATQDIAVDGWALTLLNEQNKAYASTAQTIGLNTGYFLSFTIFLALNSNEFCNKYLRNIPSDFGILQLGSYIQFWGLMFLLCNVYLLIFKKEEREEVSESESLKSVYKDMADVCRMPHMKVFIAILLLSKIGFQANEAVTPLKLIEKGLQKEDLAVSVLIDFPFQILFGYYAAKWSSGSSPLNPWLWAFAGRLFFSAIGMVLVKAFPEGGSTTSYFSTVIIVNVLTSFVSTVQFVSIGSFFTRISDPSIGGTYMTLLNTLSNLGGTWPKYFVLEAVEFFTSKKCIVDDHGIQTCTIIRDGYYITGIICVIIGTLIFLQFVLPNIKTLQKLPVFKWQLESRRAKHH